jgi:hypothetical protein
MDRDTIIAIAKERKVSAKDLIVLGADNDPFYVGSDGHHKDGKWAAEYWLDYSTGREFPYGRGFHYYLVSVAKKEGLLLPSGKPYENTQYCYDYLTYALQVACYLGYIDPTSVRDRRHPEPVDNSYHEDSNAWAYDPPDISEMLRASVDEFIMSEIRSCAPKFDISAYYTVVPVVIFEKQGMADLLAKVAEEFGIYVQPLVGEAGREKAIRIVTNLAMETTKPIRIFYVSDFDPKGFDMPANLARKVEWAISKYGGHDIKLKPVVLTAEQCIKYKLPRTPVKETESLKGRFEDAFGVGATEIDALEALYPGELAKIVRSYIKPYVDKKHLEEVEEQNSGIKVAFNTILAPLREKLKGVIEDAVSSKDFDIDLSFEAHYVPPTAELPEEPDDWLYDSSRTYMEQLDVYHETMIKYKK